jgi:hypothetical protein
LITAGSLARVFFFWASPAVHKEIRKMLQTIFAIFFNFILFSHKIE